MFKNILCVFFVGATMSVAHADFQQQTAGGWGSNCQSGNITCNSGRSIGCSATVGSSENRSYCMQQTGDVGVVQCFVYDPQGYVLAQYVDQCP